MNRISKNALLLVGATRNNATNTTKLSSCHMVNHNHNNNNSLISSAKSYHILNDQFKRQLHTGADTTKYWKIKIPSFIVNMTDVKKPENDKTFNIDGKLDLTLNNRYSRNQLTLDKFFEYLPDTLFILFCFWLFR